MIVSEARLAANRANSLKSKGPTTPEGKAISRRNAFKHGLTGEGTVIPEGEQDEISRRIEALEADLQPISEAGHILIGQMAVLSVRAERANLQESAEISMRVRNAADAFDEEQIEAAEKLFEALPQDPRNNHRKLRKTPEGVARIMDEWIDLKADLNIDPEPLWTPAQLERAGYLLGLKSQHARGSRIGALSRAYWGDFAALSQDDGAGLEGKARQAWAKTAILTAIDAELAELEAHAMTLDFETRDLDRAEAGSRALFDPSKAATLARRYEAEARRGFFKALKEFRQVEAEALANLEATSQPPAPPQPGPRMGSSRENPVAPSSPPVQSYPEPRSSQMSTVLYTEKPVFGTTEPSKTPG